MLKVFQVGLFAAAFAAAGCSSASKEAREANPAPCPNIIVLEDAARMIEFDGEQTAENIAYTAEIVDVSMSCRYYADRPIDAEVELKMAFGRGPKGAAGERAFQYFVAVTRRDSEVIAKEEFAVPVRFGNDEYVVAREEDIERIIIPRKSEETSGLNFEIVVGLALTPQQAIYNRSGKSLKFPEIQ